MLSLSFLFLALLGFAFVHFHALVFILLQICLFTSTLRTVSLLFFVNHRFTFILMSGILWKTILHIKQSLRIKDMVSRQERLRQSRREHKGRWKSDKHIPSLYH